MARLRWALLLLALGIGLPATLIVMRATESLELEIADRHETVAERIFDEMERSLSDFLLREEARAVDDYDRALGSDAGPAQGTRPFDDPDVPFVLGWYAVTASAEPRVATRIPTDARRVERAVRSVLGDRPRLADRSPLNEDPIEEAKKERAPAAADEGRALALAEVPAPGRTRSFGRATSEDRALDEEEALSQSSAYEVLQSLNRASSLRSERQSKALKRSADRTDARGLAAEPEAPATGGREARAQADLDDSGARVPAAPSAGETRADAAEAGRRAASVTPAAFVDPMIGRVAADGTLVLTRSVWREREVERQGLVLDRTRLVAWLRARVLEETGLGERARLDFDAGGTLAEPVGATYVYLHRFDEPFDDLVARLDLDPLPGLDATRSILALALLLAIAGGLGFYAVDRMARVVVDYSQRRSDFVAAVSHELKTPLTAIRMYGEMLRDGLVSSEEKRKEYHATITSESERLSRLIDNVLEFSRLEQDRRELVWIEGGLEETVRTVVGTLAPHVERSGFELLLDIDAALPPVRYDRDAITQIVFNLVDNARKYAREARSKRIEVGLRRSDDAVELRVRDDGPGVPEGQLRRIFEPFYRVGKELTRTSEGTGIGLALVRELAEQMGGRVRARLPESGGFEVVVSIPIAGGG